MKKLVLMSAALMLLGIGAFAFDLSAGAGAAVGSYNAKVDLSATVAGSTNTSTTTLKYTPFGIDAFVDATYAQLAVGYRMMNVGSITSSGTGVTTSTTNNNENFSYITFQGLAKYPFHFGKISVFPLAGILYALNLTATDSVTGTDLKASLTSQQKSDLNEVWLQGGVGADFDFGNFYIRPEGLIGYKLLNQTEKDMLSAMKTALTLLGATNVSGSITYLNYQFAIMVGYKF